MLADVVEMLPNGDLQLVGLRRTADGLQVSCVVANATTAATPTPPTEEDESWGKTPLPPGDLARSNAVKVVVSSDGSDDDPPFTGIQDLATGELSSQKFSRPCALALKSKFKILLMVV